MTAFDRRAPRFAALVAMALAAGSAPGARAAQEVSFALDVRPILESRCVACHHTAGEGGEGYAASGLDLSTYEGVMAGTRHGPVVIPGDPLSSNLIRLIEGKAAPEIRMPHDQRPLLRYQILTIRDWVKQGAEEN